MALNLERFLDRLEKRKQELATVVLNSPLSYDRYLALQGEWRGLETARVYLIESSDEGDDE